jgi:acyl-CoA thioester hydrolase
MDRADTLELPEITRVRVIYADTDQMGFVYYGNYLRYFEVARTELLRQVGMPYRDFEQREKRQLPVIEAALRYRRAARYDDELALCAAVDHVASNSRFVRFLYAIRRVDADGRPGEHLVDGHTVHACIDAEGKVTRLPPALRDAISARALPPPPAPAPGT